MTKNFYDPPYIAMIDSGTFWRCRHGHTRFRSKPGCGRCAAKRPLEWAPFVSQRIKTWWLS